jgi:tetratricopeptide (TPR) repeat protein/DNA-binding CsgD family transcriptional regulator
MNVRLEKIFYVLFCVLFIHNLSHAQPADVVRKRIDSLFAALPAAHDTTKVKIYIELSRIKMLKDEAEFLGLINKALRLSKQIHFANGLVIVYSTLGKYYTLNKADFAKAKLYLDSAKALPVSVFQMRELYYAQGVWHTLRGEFEKSHDYLGDGLKASGTKEDKLVGLIFDVMALNLSKIGRKKEAVKYYKKSIRILEMEKENATSLVAARLNNLGVIYTEMDEHDSAFVVFKRLYRLEVNYGNPLNNSSLLSNLGNLYLQKGMPDSAYYFMHAGLRAGTTGSFAYARTLCLTTLGRYHLNHNLDSALYYGYILIKHNKNGLLPDLQDMYHLLSKAHEKKGRIDSAFYYQTKYLFYHDSLMSVKRSEQVAALEAEFELASKAKAIERLEKDRQQEKFKKYALLTGLCFLSILVLLAAFYYRLKMQARQREIEIKNIQLANFTRTMIEKSALVEDLRVQLDLLKSEISPGTSRTEKLSQILNASILTDDDWENFKSLFEQVYPGFFAGLKLKYPELTSGEIRLCALLKLNLTSKEISDMLGISAESANTARYRLRKKLELSAHQDLSNVISNLT